MVHHAGDLIGDYRITALIGAGAYGEVFKAEHVITRRVDAIKFLTNGTPASSEDEQRYLREIELQASLQHPNIAAVHNAFRTPAGLALVMELVEGEPLASILARERVPLRRGADYVLQTLAALAYAHERGVVHRDVKPGNIIVAADGSVKLTDFGLARRMAGPQLTSSGALTGSPYYMSPEQVVGLNPADERSDVYAVGVVLYEIATGRRPFEDASAFQVMLQHRDCAPAAPITLDAGIGPEIDAVIMRALEKDPARRYQSAPDFRAALEEALLAAPAAPAPVRQRRGYRAAAAAVFLLLAGGVTMLVANYGHFDAPPPPVVERPLQQAPMIQPPPPAVTAPAPPPVTAAEEAPAPPAIPAKRAVKPKAPPLRQAAVAPVGAMDVPPAMATSGSTGAAAAGPFAETPAASHPAPDPPPQLPPMVADAPPVAASTPTAAPQPKGRHFVWRAIGRIVRPGANVSTAAHPAPDPAPQLPPMVADAPPVAASTPAAAPQPRSLRVARHRQDRPPRREIREGTGAANTCRAAVAFSTLASRLQSPPRGTSTCLSVSTWSDSSC